MEKKSNFSLLVFEKVKAEIMRVFFVEKSVFESFEMNKFKRILAFVLNRYFGWPDDNLNLIFGTNPEKARSAVLCAERMYLECSVSRAQILVICKNSKEKIEQ